MILKEDLSKWSSEPRNRVTFQSILIEKIQILKITYPRVGAMVYPINGDIKNYIFVPAEMTLVITGEGRDGGGILGVPTELQLYTIRCKTLIIY